MAEDRTGIATAVDLLMSKHADGTDARRAEQLSLMPTPAAIAEIEERPKGVKVGRPAGSLNRATSDMTKFILARYPHPLLFLAEAYSRPVEQLAAELGCKVAEAFAIQVDAAKNLAPYVAQKQPMAVQVSASGEVTLMIAMTPQGAAPVAGDGAIVINPETEDNQ